jgi:hypothetical protein
MISSVERRVDDQRGVYAVREGEVKGQRLTRFTSPCTHTHLPASVFERQMFEKVPERQMF